MFVYLDTAMITAEKIEGHGDEISNVYQALPERYDNHTEYS